MAIGPTKPLSLKPAAGLLDLRSDAADIAPGHRRIILNQRLVDQGREGRAGGWQKLFGDSAYGFLNQDLHDQLLTLQKFYPVNRTETNFYGYDVCEEALDVREGCPEAITFLFEHSTETGTRRLIAGNNQRLYELSERSRNWRLLADGLGNPTLNPDTSNCQPCAGHRFHGAQLLGYLVATNDYDVPVAYQGGAQADGCELWAARPISDLISLGVSRVGTVEQFRGFMLYGDIEMDGVSQPGLLLNSDFNNPTEVLPLIGTNLARSLTIGFGEKILRFAQLGDYIIAYTDKAIHRGQLNIQTVGDNVAQVLSFTEIYRGPHCLKYKFSLVNTGTEHVFGAVDGVYVLRSAFSPPERVEWLHRATGAIYGGITQWDRELGDLPAGLSLNYGPLNTGACNNFIGGYNPMTREIWFSWPTDENVCANLSLRISTQTGYEHASIVDHGFSAFCFYRSDTRPSWDEWLLEVAGCEPEVTAENKTGASQLSSNLTPPPHIWNADEDIDVATAEDSFCALLDGTTLDDICAECQPAPVFISASASDLCLKEMRDDLYFRERWTGSEYEDTGYFSFTQTSIGELRSDVEKAFGGASAPGLVVEYRALTQTTPSKLYAQVGIAQQASCPDWRNVGNRELRCLTEKTKAQHAAQRTRADRNADYGFYYRGRYLSFRLWVSGTGGGHTLDRVDAYVRNAQG